MRTIFKHKLFLVLLYPMIVGYTPKKGSETWLDLVLGVGSLLDVSYDCAGNVINVDRHRYMDANAAVRYKTNNFVMSGNVGFLSSTYPFFYIKDSYIDTNGNYFPAEQSGSSPYAGIRVGFDFHYFGMEVGGIGFTRKVGDMHFLPSGMIRIGSDGGFAFRINVFNNNSLLSSGVASDLGFSFALKNEASNIYFGLGGDIAGSTLVVTKIKLSNTEQTNAFYFGGALGGQGGYSCGAVSIGYSTKLSH